MRTSGIVVLVAFLWFSFAIPAAVIGAEQHASWRQRASSAEAEVIQDDVREEVTFGREIAARMVGRYSLYDNGQLTKYVNLVGKAIALNTNRPEIDFHFGVLNTDEINAYAAPGGYVFVTRGALMKMQDEAELAGVLAHEIGHIVERHVVKELNIHGTEGSASSGLARLIGGGSDAARVAFYQSVDKALDILFKTGYKRDDEVQADRDALLFCALAGYDPAGLVRYFERLGAAKGRNTEVLDKTHPSYETRIAWLKGTMAGEGMEPGTFKTFKERFAEVMKTAK